MEKTNSIVFTAYKEDGGYCIDIHATGRGFIYYSGDDFFNQMKSGYPSKFEVIENPDN